MGCVPDHQEDHAGCERDKMRPVLSAEVLFSLDECDDVKVHQRAGKEGGLADEVDGFMPFEEVPECIIAGHECIEDLKSEDHQQGGQRPVPAGGPPRGDKEEYSQKKAEEHADDYKNREESEHGAVFPANLSDPTNT